MKYLYYDQAIKSLSEEHKMHLRMRIAHEVNFYRYFLYSNAGYKHGMPTLRKSKDCDWYETSILQGGVTLYIYPVIEEETHPSIGGHARNMRVLWQVSTEVMVGGSRMHPAESDEMIVVEGARSIAEAITKSRHFFYLEELKRAEESVGYEYFYNREMRKPEEKRLI